MKLKHFQLERYFAQYEFSACYLLSSSNRFGFRTLPIRPDQGQLVIKIGISFKSINNNWWPSFFGLAAGKEKILNSK